MIATLKRFRLKLGRDFAFMGAAYPVQVGMDDFRIDHDVRKPHENPSIGVLLCASNDQAVAHH